MPDEGNGRWSREDNLQIVKRIHRWKVKKINARTLFINLENNQRFKLIKDIVNIDFPNLISLNIPNNHITSIEELIFVNMPNIQHLSLCKLSSKADKNRIRSLRVLRKVHRHSLLSFSTCNLLFISETNFICDIGTLTQAFLPKVKSLSVYWHDKYEGNSVDQAFDPFSLAKLKL